MVVVLDLNAVIGVNATAAEAAVAGAQGVFTHAVIVKDQGQPRLGSPQDLPSQTWLVAEPPIGLPAVDDPRLDLQLVSREPLNSQSIEKPRRVGRNIRRLVSPVVEVVIAEQPD